MASAFSDILDEARLSARAQAALTRVAAVVLREQELMVAMRLLAQEATQLLGVQLLAVGVPDEFAGVVRYDVAEGPHAPHFDASPVEIGDSLAGISNDLTGVPDAVPNTADWGRFDKAVLG